MGWFNHQLAKAMLGEKTHHQNLVKDPNHSDQRGQSALILAASFGQREVVKRLLEVPKWGRIPMAKLGNFRVPTEHSWLVVSNMFYFHPLFGDMIQFD